MFIPSTVYAQEEGEKFVEVYRFDNLNLETPGALIQIVWEYATTYSRPEVESLGIWKEERDPYIYLIRFTENASQYTVNITIKWKDVLEQEITLYAMSYDDILVKQTYQVFAHTIIFIFDDITTRPRLLPATPEEVASVTIAGVTAAIQSAIRELRADMDTDRILRIIDIIVSIISTFVFVGIFLLFMQKQGYPIAQSAKGILGGGRK